MMLCQFMVFAVLTKRTNPSTSSMSVLLLAGESCQLPPGLCPSSISAYASELASEDDYTGSYN
jgi:hypothetical protein